MYEVSSDLSFRHDILAWLDHWLMNVSLLHFAAHWEGGAVCFLLICFCHGASVQYEIYHMGSFCSDSYDCHYLRCNGKGVQ
jgi:hypothetical protein